MTDKFHPIPLPGLLELTLSQIRQNKFFGIPASLFYIPDPSDPFRMERYGQVLETPVGVAAGPHTQLSVNLIAAWLCGARYLELKTVQTLDELEVSKPCIDIQDEGYNCEWSQELKIEQSFDEYLNAWIMIHILRKELGFQGPLGTLFNMSVGYNLEGILKDNVQGFFAKMQDCTTELNEKIESVREIYPAIDEIRIPVCISNHITLSTMHGCPPEEIEKIGLYLINQMNLHTTIKLNPTLLGAAELRSLLNNELGFTAEIPDLAFEHDLKYPDALRIIASLSRASQEKGLQFSIKLTNTLESVNNKNIFPGKETMMYMSGRALHPVSIRVARKLQNDLGGNLDVSFSAGADCFNIAELLACGMRPVTVCSDLLKPGGYGRLWQYISNLRTSFANVKAESIADFIIKRSGSNKNVIESALSNLNHYADKVAGNPAYRKKALTDPDIKTSRPLNLFDCIHAPCIDTCPTNQDIPRYMHSTATGDFAAAFKTIFDTNPFPSVTGMVCDHLCQSKCTRINYDEALHIREIKRFVAEGNFLGITPDTVRPNGYRAAVIGAGPAGLSCAWFLNLAGFEVHVFEQKEKTGGMVSAAIPSFRLTDEAIARDIDRIKAAGVKVHENYRVDKKNFESIRKQHQIIFLAAGAQESSKLIIDGINAEGVLDPLDFLFKVRDRKPVEPGRQVLIIGGGNTAMDAARTAFRMIGAEGKVTVVYRRTTKEMPADKGEIQAVLDEGIEILELTNPEKVLSQNGNVTGLLCSRNELSGKGKDGRPVPVKISGSEFELTCDTIIPAIGQQLAIDLFEPGELTTEKGSYKTRIEGLYIGGDALRGASTAINAIADGRKAAAEIIADLQIPVSAKDKKEKKDIDMEFLLHQKAIRIPGLSPDETAQDDRKNFNLVMASLSQEEAQKEASRCLQCDEVCNVCVMVCPNLANFSYQVEPVHYMLRKATLQADGSISLENDETFSVDQEFQVLNIRDLCNECGNCTTFCPTSGKPFLDKPALCLSEESFNLEDSGFILRELPDRQVLVYKHDNQFEMLYLKKGRYFYESEDVKATIHPADFNILHIKFITEEPKSIQFHAAAQMSIILKAASQLTTRQF